MQKKVEPTFGSIFKAVEARAKKVSFLHGYPDYIER